MSDLKEGPPLTPETVTEAAASSAELAVAPELVAHSLGEYLRAWAARIRAGDSGILPVIVGLVVIAIIFQSQNSNFLTAGNLVNLLVQGAAITLLGLGEVFALLLGEIDLSIGFVAGVAGVIAAELVAFPHNWPWWAAVGLALLVTAVIGLVQGSIITRLGLPSFVVTLAGLLGFQGVMLMMVGPRGTVPIASDVINDFANGNMTVGAGWVLTAVLIVGYAGLTWWRDRRRRASGLVAPPLSLTLLKIAAVAVAGVALVLICNANRGLLVPIQGVPWVVLIVLGVLAAWSVLLGRTRFGRYVYAIGGNAEAARRSGVNLARIRTTAFILCSLTAGIAGIVYASRLRSVSTNLDGGTLVLYAVAAAVIGGTSLFGGRGRPLHAVLGGVVIAAIANGMGLLGMAAATQLIVTALVLLAAVTIDAVARRGRTAAGTR
ncbi:MAG TPA: ABC transporter permease [Actinomycetota bacterium]|jgi:D-xylose transport system permease protein|nr:ABC transporter permease [Actinomycetota bacterium]